MPPLDLGSQKQLFIDDYCVEEMAGVRRHLHEAKKHPANPILVPEEWWEDFFVQAYGNVLYDPEQQQFRMWYNAVSRADVVSVCHATSSDGINWERSKFNVFEHKGRVLSNAVMVGSYRLPTVFHAPDEPDPLCRYRAIMYCGTDVVDLKAELRSGFRHGYGVFFSPDGIHWTAYERNPVIQGSDMCTCCYDPVSKEYIAFVKLLSTAGGRFRRCVGISTSRDFTNWGVVQMLLSADEIDDARVADRLYRFRDVLIYDDPKDYLADLYGMSGFRYEGLRMGLIWLYDRSGDRSVEHGGNDDGIINAQLVYSRDENPYAYWHRVGDRRDFIPCGNEGDFDAGMVLPASTVIEVGDEIWFYYTGCDGPHNWDSLAPDRPKPMSKIPMTKGFSIGLATLRRDGFVSVYASYPPGRLITKPFIFAGDKLEINADAENGQILVEMLDQDGRPVPGFTKDECVPFTSDAIRGAVVWNSGTNLRTLEGKPVRLAFNIACAKLYAFRFAED